MTIAHKLENALSRYLSTESSAASGGIFLLKTASGTGTQITIRTGHDDAGDLPDSAFIVIACEDDEVRQLVLGANLFSITARIMLAYAGHDTSADTSTLASFQYAQRELERLLVVDNIKAIITGQGDGIECRGETEPIAYTTAIDGHRRTAEWRLSLACSVVEAVV
jgi:hypothetical protein